MQPLLFLLLTLAAPVDRPAFAFQPGQRVYVASTTTASRDTSLSSMSLQIERHTRQAFAKLKTFRPVNSLDQADFVFLIVLDDSRRRPEELALAISPADYKAALQNLDALRAASLWQSYGTARKRDIGLATATMGWSAVVHPPSVCANLVRQFHREVLGSQQER